MKLTISLLCLSALTAVGAEPALTIYNQNFAVVRDTVTLDLKSGVNQVRYADATAHLEPDSVVLRDPAGKRSLQVLEQNYRADPVSQELLLSLFEGKTIEFETFRMKDNTQIKEVVKGKIIRSGYVPGGGMEQPIIEVDGKLRFSLPGQPIFPSLGDDTVLKPTLHWLIKSGESGKLDAEVGYITGGFTWEADYNLVAPEQGDMVDVIGWVTMKNESGKAFRDAKIKLMAGDVQKIQQMPRAAVGWEMAKSRSMMDADSTVTEKSFDEFHLYTLARPTTLLDRETKQVEFVRATGVKAPVIYVYDATPQYRFYGGLNYDRGYGSDYNKKVQVTREFVNAETNHLGMALPKGKLRFYRSNDDKQMEFIGEDLIDHTPRNETVRVTTGNSFDLVGERKQTDFRVDTSEKWVDESFEVKVRNRKKEAVEVRVVEHLYRWSNWEVTKKSDDFKKLDSQTIEYRVKVKPDEEKTISYTVHYSW